MRKVIVQIMSRMMRMKKKTHEKDLMMSMSQVEFMILHVLCIC